MNTAFIYFAILNATMNAATRPSQFFSVMTYNVHELVQRTSYPNESLSQLYEEPSILSGVMGAITAKRADVLLIQEVPTKAFFNSVTKNRVNKQMKVEQQEVEMDKRMGAAGYVKVVCEQASTFVQNCIYVKSSLNAVSKGGKVLMKGKRSMAVAEITLGNGETVTVVATHVDSRSISALAAEVCNLTGNVIVGADFNLPLSSVLTSSLSSFKCAQDCQANGKPSFPRQNTLASSSQFTPSSNGTEVDFVIVSPDAQKCMVATKVDYGQLVSDHVPVVASFIFTGTSGHQVKRLRNRLQFHCCWA